MAEEYKKSRFKRKKLFSDPCLTELPTCNKSSEGCVTNRSAVQAHAWWVSDELTGIEHLWSFSLQSALQCVQSESRDPVPELPTTLVTSGKPKPSEWRWCSLSEEVIPFPEPSPPPCPPMAFLSPPSDPLHLCPSLERTLAAPAESTNTLSTHGLPARTPSPQCLTGDSACSSRQGHTTRDSSSKDRRPKPTFKVRGDRKDNMAKTGTPTMQHDTVYVRAASLPESDRDPSAQHLTRGSLPGSRSDKKMVEEEKEQGSLIKGQLPAHQGEASDSRTASMRVEEMRRKEEKEVSGSCGVDLGRGTGSGEAAAGGCIQSCPMCLVVFPAGFTQMDCDGHLAQCLSEMNVDMEW